MNIKEFISGFTNYPILFLGSGFSLRYLEHSYNWSDLLLEASKFLTGNDRIFLRSRNLHTRDNDCDYEDVATDIEKAYEDVLDKVNDAKFTKLNDKYYESLRNGDKVSRLKLRIVEMVSDLSRRPEKEEEFQSFVIASKNINSIITTNYDELVESSIQFKPYVGNDILLSNPYGAIYKVHGSVTVPSSIIVTHDDYQKFNEEYELIRAQLISLFTRNPIIFIGYGLHDKDINRLLNTIFKYVDYKSDLSKKIRKNFLVIEYEQNSKNLEVQEFDMIMGSQSIRINMLRTDDFMAVYNAIAELSLPVSARDIQRLRNVVIDIYEGKSNIKVKIYESIESLHDGDAVLAIGSKWHIRYENMQPKDYIDQYFTIIEEQDEDKIKAIDQIKIQKNQYFPVYGFNSIYPHLNQFNRLKEIEDAKILSIKKKVEQNNKYCNTHKSIKDIIDDDSIVASNRVNCIQYGLFHNNISLAELKNELLRNKEGYNGTHYNSLIVIYDYLAFGQLDS